MPGPTDPVSPWSTDASFPAGADPWSATPTKVEPSAGEKAGGLVPATKPPAGWFNWLWSNFSLWLIYLASFFDDVNDEFIYPSVKIRTVELSLRDFTRTTEADWNFTGTGEFTATAALSVLSKDMAGILPSGGQIASIQVVLTPAAARATVGQRMSVSLVRRAGDYATPAIVAETSDSQTDDGLAAIQLVTLIPTTGNILTPDFSLAAYSLVIVSGSVTGPFTDSVQSVRVGFTDPGPRNF